MQIEKLNTMDMNSDSLMENNHSEKAALRKQAHELKKALVFSRRNNQKVSKQQLRKIQNPNPITFKQIPSVVNSKKPKPQRQKGQFWEIVEAIIAIAIGAGLVLGTVIHIFGWASGIWYFVCLFAFWITLSILALFVFFVLLLLLSPNLPLS